MSDSPLRLLQVALLVGAWIVGYFLWIRPRQAGLDLQSLGLLLLVLLTFAGGLIGGIFWWLNEPNSFGWRLPDLGARLLGAAAWAYAAGAAYTLWRPTPGRLRLILVLLFVYLAPLGVSVIAFHLGRFDPAAQVTYGFFTVVIGMTASTIWWLVRPPPIVTGSAPDAAPGLAIRGWFVVVAIVLGLWGLALFVTDAGLSSLMWVWPGDPLTSQLIGVMLLALAAGA